MGFAIAEKFFFEGQDIKIISGPTNYKSIIPYDNIHHVISADEMYEATKKYFEWCDIAIFCAAVADYKPAVKMDEKFKKEQDEFTIKWIKNPDIALNFGLQKKENQFSIGFALETNNLIDNALQKLQKKNFDLVMLNSPNNVGEGFNYNTNNVTFLDNKGNVFLSGLKTKKDIATELYDWLKNQSII